MYSHNNFTGSIDYLVNYRIILYIKLSAAVHDNQYFEMFFLILLL